MSRLWSTAVAKLLKWAHGARLLCCAAHDGRTGGRNGETPMRTVFTRAGAVQGERQEKEKEAARGAEGAGETEEREGRRQSGAFTRCRANIARLRAPYGGDRSRAVTRLPSLRRSTHVLMRRRGKQVKIAG